MFKYSDDLQDNYHDLVAHMGSASAAARNLRKALCENGTIAEVEDWAREITLKMTEMQNSWKLVSAEIKRQKLDNFKPEERNNYENAL